MCIASITKSATAYLNERFERQRKMDESDAAGASCARFPEKHAIPRNGPFYSRHTALH